MIRYFVLRYLFNILKENEIKQKIRYFLIFLLKQQERAIQFSILHLQDYKKFNDKDFKILKMQITNFNFH